MIVYWSIWDLKNSQIWRKASPKQDLRRLQKDYETHLKSSTSSHKQALSKESRIWLDWKWTLGEFGTTCHHQHFFQWMKCQLCKVIVSSSYYFCFLSRDNAFVWKVIKIELLISRHKQQCWAGATYNFRNKSDALIKALAILPDPTSRIQFKAFICLFEENLQILKYWRGIQFEREQIFPRWN